VPLVSFLPSEERSLGWAGAALGYWVGKVEARSKHGLLLAPIFWIALDDPTGVAKFPNRSVMMVVVVVITIVASVFFAEELSRSHLQQPYTFHVSVVTFWAAVLVLYLSTVYHTNRLNVPEAFRDQEASFRNAFRSHRR